jgi:O-6-methylguanine DNA methyltransferase
MIFSEQVYQITKRIPKGKVATYGQIARLAGNPKAARVVGRLMKENPNTPDTPCHRVVGSDGTLVGYSGVGGIKTKKNLLLFEGVKFHKDKVALTISLWKK